MQHPADKTLWEGESTIREEPGFSTGRDKRTLRENSSLSAYREDRPYTVCHSSPPTRLDATLRETGTGTDQATQREAQTAEAAGVTALGSHFHEYRILRQQASASSEADIFIMADERGSTRLLKLYRFGIVPKTEVLRTVRQLGEAHPDTFVRLYEVDFDARVQRWYTVQEYMPGGSLQTLLEDPDRLPEERRPGLFTELAREAGRALHILHQNNILHLDLKPANILLRTLSPLNLALIDFGIATSLDPEMSRKFTQTRGTPMYQSPESWAGSMSRSSDWWGLGMVLLELATGRHPFSGLSGNVIASALATRPVPVPDTLEEEQQDLLHGLLTRDPGKRWHWEQVSRWLAGERGIPHFFEGAESLSSGQKVRPLLFMGHPCHSLADLAQQLVRSEAAWAQGRAMLMRGQVRQWLESTQRLEAGVGLDSVLAGGGEDPDLRTFHFAAAYGSGAEFVFLGHRITLNNLALFASRPLLDAPASAAEQQILDAAASGLLLALLDLHIRQRGASAEAETATLKPFLLRLRTMSQDEAALFLDFCLDPEKYFCPFVSLPATPESVLRETAELQGLPLTRERWNRLEQDYVLPDAVRQKMQQAASYHEAAVWLDQMVLQGQGLRRTGMSADQAQAISAFLPCCLASQRTRPFLHFCLHPELYHSPFLSVLEPPERVAQESADLEVLPLSLDEWKRLSHAWIVPNHVVRWMQRANTYHQGLAWLEENQDTLLPRTGLSKEEAGLFSLCSLDLRSQAVRECFLDFCRNPEHYCCPFVRDTATPESVARDASGLTRPPLTREHWECLAARYSIPDDIRQQMQSAATYGKAVDCLEMRIQQGLLPQNRRRVVERRLVQGLLYGLTMGVIVGFGLFVLDLHNNQGVIHSEDMDFIVFVVLVIVSVSVVGNLWGAYLTLKRDKREEVQQVTDVLADGLITLSARVVQGLARTRTKVQGHRNTREQTVREDG